MRRAFLLVSFGVFSLAAIAKDSVTITSDPRDLSRPVSTLIDQIRKRDKISITYEDPRYSNQADIEDVTTEVSRAPELEKTYGPRILVPKGRPIVFVYAPADMHRSETAMATVNRMLQEYASVGGPVFAVVGDGTRLHVVPSSVLAHSGSLAHQDSVLDTIVSVPAAPRDGGELLQAVCDAVQKQTGFEIGIGPSVPGNYLARYQTSAGIRKETARAAIAGILDQASVKGIFDWDLYYDPADRAYMLNFAYVGPAAQPNP
jgi:hypothetical protein